MSFNQYLHKNQKVLHVIKGIYKHKALQFRNDGVKIDYTINFTGERDIDYVLEQLRSATSQILELYIYAQCLGEGPKIFEPKQFDLEMLSAIDVNINFSDYNQPYPTIIIQLPKELRHVENLQGDCNEHSADFCILHHDKSKNYFIFCVTFNSGYSIKTNFAGTDDRIIESAISNLKNQMLLKDSETISDSENELCDNLLRASLNYALLIDDMGAKKIGYKNPAHAARLERRGNIDELKELPVYYELNQEVKLYRTVEKHSDLPSTTTGRKMPPHHRRGYYKQQPYGPKNELRKRIRIPAVFVNSYLFGGDVSDTRVTYGD